MLPSVKTKVSRVTNRKAQHPVSEQMSELEKAQLEQVQGGASFLVGSLTAQEDATAWVNTGTANQNGFIMKDSIIVRTSGR